MSRPCLVPAIHWLKQDYPSKKTFFWLNPYKIEVVITRKARVVQLCSVNYI